MICIIEFGQKGTLLNVIQRQDPHFNSFRNVLLFFKQLAEGVELMHKMDIIHADLKLDNVVVTSENKPLIIDFDLAVENGDVDNVRGTRSYMSPEIIKSFKIRKNPTYNPAVDLYAMGVIFYAMVKQHFPLYYNNFSYDEMVNANVHFDKGDKKDFKEICSLLICLESQRISDDELHEKLVETLLKKNYEVITRKVKYNLNSLQSQIYSIYEDYDENSNSFSQNDKESKIEKQCITIEIIILISIIFLIIAIIILLIWFGKKTKNRNLQNSLSQKFTPGQNAFDLKK